MADYTYKTPKGDVLVKHMYYIASCDKCGWIGSSEACGTDIGDDSDVYCPDCGEPGADCGKVAEKLERNREG